MDNIFQVLQSQLTPEVISTLSKQIRTDEKTAANAAQTAISAIVGAMSKNTSNPQSASSLMSALDKNHDGSILNNILGVISGSAPSANSKSTNGLGILEHVLGGNVNNIVGMLSQGTGLDFLKSANLLQLLAPIVMGSLGQARKQNNIDQNNIFDYLNTSVKQAAPQREELSLITRILDADGDGSIMDDLAGMGIKALGGFFNRK